MDPLIVVLAVLAGLVALWALVTFNSLVRARNRIDNAWSQVDVQLKRRYDLIPNLVETVRGYAEHERETLEAVTLARQAGLSAESVPAQADAENLITAALRRLFVLAEAYPELKANESFLRLQEELTATEDRIAYARQFYNDSVLRYDNKLETFPTMIVAALFAFEPRPYFEIEDPRERGPVQTTFS